MKKLILAAAIMTFLLSCASIPDAEKPDDSLVIGTLSLDFPNGFFDRAESRTIQSYIQITIKNVTQGTSFTVPTSPDGHFAFLSNGSDSYGVDSYDVEVRLTDGKYHLQGRLNYNFTVRPKVIFFIGDLVVTYVRPQKEEFQPDQHVKLWNFNLSFARKYLSSPIEYLSKMDPKSHWLAYVVQTPETHVADLFELAKTGTQQSVQTDIDMGANVNAQDKDGVTPLMAAARYNQNPEVIATLLKAGADVNAQAKDGVTALMRAGYNENPEVVTSLLKAGADIKAQADDDSTALMSAARHNRNPEVIGTLLNAGANLNAQNKAGNTALMLAARYNQTADVIAALLNAGANAKTKNSAGKTAFDEAQNNEELKGTDAYRQLEEASQ